MYHANFHTKIISFNQLKHIPSKHIPSKALVAQWVPLESPIDFSSGSFVGRTMQVGDHDWMNGITR